MLASITTAQSVPGHGIATWATGLTNGVSVDVDDAGNIWVGHEDNGAPTRIWRTGASAGIGGTAALFGDTNLPDPDIALLDPVGLVSGVAGLSLPVNIPVDPTLDGLIVCLQAFQPDPAAVAGLAASRGLELRFGP